MRQVCLTCVWLWLIALLDEACKPQRQCADHCCADPVAGCFGLCAVLCCVVCCVLCTPGTSPEWATLRYPENLTVSNMLYYLAAPTLTYQVCSFFWVEGLGPNLTSIAAAAAGLNLNFSGALLLLHPLCAQVNFPRSPRVRKRWLLRRVLELAAFTGLLLFIANQYLEPAVSNAMKPLNESDWLRVLERVLKLALPNLYAWLVRGTGGGVGRGLECG